MIRYLLSVLVLLALAFVLRQFVPVIPDFHHARIFLVPLVFLCVSVTLNVSGMLLLSFVCGLLWDAQHTILPAGGDPGIYLEQVETLRFGYSILLFAFAGFVMHGVQPVFREGKWQLSTLVTGVALFLYLLAELLLLSFVRGRLVLSASTFSFILYSSLLTMLLSPFVFYLLFKLADLFDYRIRYDGLRKGRRR
jgi:cell shape-determining protein MreD